MCPINFVFMSCKVKKQESPVELCGSKNFISVSGFLEQKNLGSVSVIFKKEEQYKCMNSFMYVSSIFTK